MTNAALLEQFDLPTRCAQEPKISQREIGIVQHHRVELMQRLPRPVGLDDDEPAVISEPAATAAISEEADQPLPLPTVLLTLNRSPSGRLEHVTSGG